MDFLHASQIFDHLYHDINGYVLSARGRQERGNFSKSFTYGEVTPKEFYQILQIVTSRKEEVFYDLGSGTGKAVVLAALLAQFGTCMGIELMQPLYDAAESVVKRLKTEYAVEEADKIAFINNDFLNVDFTNGNVFFLHSTCFDENILPALEEKLTHTKKGSRIVTVTTTLTNDVFEQYDERQYNMGWGKASCYFYKRI